MERIRRITLICALFFCHTALGKAACVPTGENYILNSNFSKQSKSGAVEHWGGIQHAGVRSFERTIVGDELTIHRIGPESWFFLKQKIEARQLAGKKVAFSAEIKMASQTTSIYYSDINSERGLLLSAKPKYSDKLLLRTSMAPESATDNTEWQKIQIVARLPKKTGFVELGFLHQSDGSMTIRHPSLQLLDESKHKCRKTTGVKSR